jgi:Tol biopolymer transport system component
MMRSLLVVCGFAATLMASQQPPPSLITEARISPDGQSIALVRQGGPGGQSLGVFRIDFGGQGEKAIAAAAGLVSDLRWSPSGDAIAYLSRRAPGAPGTLQIASAAGGAPRTIAADGRDVVAYQWSLDGRRILYASAPPGDPDGPRQMNVVSVGGGESTAPFPSIEPPPLRREAFASIRDTVVFASPAGDGHSVTLSNGTETWIDLIGRDGNRVTVMPPGIARIVAAPTWSADGTRFAVLASPGGGSPEVFAGTLPRPQPTGANMGAVPPMVRQVTGTPR